MGSDTPLLTKGEYGNFSYATFQSPVSDFSLSRPSTHPHLVRMDPHPVRMVFPLSVKLRFPPLLKIFSVRMLFPLLLKIFPASVAFPLLVEIFPVRVAFPLPVKLFYKMQPLIIALPTLPMNLPLPRALTAFCDGWLVVLGLTDL